MPGSLRPSATSTRWPRWRPRSSSTTPGCATTCSPSRSTRGGDAAVRGPLDGFHESTPPNDWLESIIKAYVGDGLATDFYREVAAFVADGATRGLVLESLADTGQAEFAVAKVRAAIAADPDARRPAGAVGRRLVGEALIQAQRVAVERDALTELLVGGSGDLAGVGRLLAGSPTGTPRGWPRWACSPESSARTRRRPAPWGPAFSSWCSASRATRSA
jgi:hypothetical protein